MKTKIYVWCLLLVGLTACKPNNWTYADFRPANGASTKGMFRPYGMQTIELSDGELPVDCYMLDGTLASEYDADADTIGAAAMSVAGGGHKASSVTMTQVVQNLVEFGNNNKVVQISGVYDSYNIVDGQPVPITLSGKVVMPAGRHFKRYILASHFTIGSNREAPSNCFPFEGILASLGYCVIVPDYIGYGVTADQVHPYLCMDVTALNVIQMFTAVRRYFTARDIKPEHDDIILMGYSQGGANTMAIQRIIELYCRDSESLDEDYAMAGLNLDTTIQIHRVFAGGGPYDVKTTFEQYVTKNRADYPVAVPLVMQGMLVGNSLDKQGLKYTDVMQPWVYKNLDEWINSKKYTTAQVNALIGTKQTSKMLTEQAMDLTNSKVSILYQSMTTNSIAAYNWQPDAPVYMLHSMDDETVTFLNATQASSRWADANITYNFGHYGGHQKTFLRFLSTVKKLLKKESD